MVVSREPSQAWEVLSGGGMTRLSGRSGVVFLPGLQSGSPWANHLSALFLVLQRMLGEHESASSKENLSCSFTLCHNLFSLGLLLAESLE